MIRDQQWQNGAACRGPHQNIFFPPSYLERRRDKRQREAVAKQICARCRVLEQCLEYSMTVQEQYGIWGGLTETERRRHFASLEVEAI